MSRTFTQSVARDIDVRVFETASTTGATGKTLAAIELSKNGGAFAAITPTQGELSGGWYRVSLTAVHTDTGGDLVLRATAVGCDDIEEFLGEVRAAPATEAAVTAVPAAVGALTVEAGYSLLEVQRLMAAVLLGDATTPAGDGEYTFTGLDGATVRVTVTRTGTSRVTDSLVET